MNTLKRVSRYALIASIALFVAACANQMEPAQQAIAGIESAVAAAGADAEKYVPEKLAAVRGSLDELKAAFDRKDYKSVIAGAPSLLTEAQGLAAAAAAKKDEVMAALGGEWTQLSAELPGAVASVEARIGELAKARRLPKGIDKSMVENASAGLAETQALWTEAGAAFGAGALEDAVAKARSVRVRINGLMETLGMSKPAA